MNGLPSCSALKSENELLSEDSVPGVGHVVAHAMHGAAGGQKQRQGRDRYTHNKFH